MAKELYADQERDAYSIAEFCQRHGISQSFYFAETKAGRGPRVMRLGTRVLISKEAAAEWRRDIEATRNRSFLLARKNDPSLPQA